MSNKCPDKNILQEFLDNPKSSEISAELRKHIESCPNCKAELTAFSALFSNLNRISTTPCQTDISSRVSSVMAAINLSPQRISSSEKGSTISNLLKNFNFKFAFAGLTVILLLFIASFYANKTNLQQNTKHRVTSSFNLEKNKVTPLISSDESFIESAGQKLALTSINQIELKKEYKLSNGLSLAIRSGENRFKLKSAARFSFSNSTIQLDEGDLLCEMNGPHDGFMVITPFASVSTLGTDFEVSIKDWGLKVKLNSGKILLKTKAGMERKLLKPETIYISTQGSFSTSIPQPETGLPANNLPDRSTNPIRPEKNNSEGTEPKSLEESF